MADIIERNAHLKDMTPYTSSNFEVRQKAVDQAVVEDLHRTIKGILSGQFDYVKIEDLERGLIALAVLRGARGFIDLDDAIDFLAHGEFDDKEKEQVVIVDDEQKTDIVEVLEEAANVLKRVPGQQVLASRVLQESVNLSGIKPVTVIEIDEPATSDSES